MSRRSRLLACLVLLATLALAACAGGEKRRINPPRASVQELAVQDDGRWRVSVRLQNFSSVPTEFAGVDAQLEVGGQPAGALALQPALVVGPESADVAVVVVAPQSGAKSIVAAALASGQSVRYRVSGQISTREPKGSFRFEYDSALSPVPGLAGVLR
jgi:uncharacterized lipoprotein YmbA